jgi:methylenetetrahydrofolate dehydrogenase (NADP+)/methenyltetrahydrofolate cyclohydrolase
MAQILYGKPVAEKIDQKTSHMSKGAKIAVLLPNDPSSVSYKKAIISKAEKIGVQVVSDPNEADGVIGKNIDPSKDIDCQTEINLGKLFAGNPLFKPATAEAVIELLKHYGIELSGKNVVVIGRSTIVGKPLAHLLLDEDATVTICHSKTLNLGSYTKNADIVVSAAGKPNLVTEDMVNNNSIIVDVGTNFVDGKLVGDVDFEKVEPLVKAISPVPGGVGPITASILLKHTCESAKKAL